MAVASKGEIGGEFKTSEASESRAGTPCGAREREATTDRYRSKQALLIAMFMSLARRGGRKQKRKKERKKERREGESFFAKSRIAAQFAVRLETDSNCSLR